MPTVELDPVAAALWHAELRQSGLPFAVRCLATWWRVQDKADPTGSPAAVAAAVAGAIARAAGTRRTKAETTAIYKTDPALVERAAHGLKGSLRLDRVRGW